VLSRAQSYHSPKCRLFEIGMGEGGDRGLWDIKSLRLLGKCEETGLLEG